MHSLCTSAIWRLMSIAKWSEIQWVATYTYIDRPLNNRKDLVKCTRLVLSHWRQFQPVEWKRKRPSEKPNDRPNIPIWRHIVSENNTTTENGTFYETDYQKRWPDFKTLPSTHLTLYIYLHFKCPNIKWFYVLRLINQLFHNKSSVEKTV